MIISIQICDILHIDKMLNNIGRKDMKEFNMRRKDMKEFGIVHKDNKNKDYSIAKLFGEDVAKKARKFHSSFPNYDTTPLLELNNLAEFFGVDKIFVKDESKRFGLNAFKVLGGSYSIGRYIADKVGRDIDEISYDMFVNGDIKKLTGEMTFVTATDGNHGRGVAWSAEKFGYNSVVYMPKGSAKERLENIRKAGADASITDMNYDDAVRFALSKSEENNWVMVQDTAWEGYEKIPRCIMEGYTTIALEIIDQIGNTRPTHVFLQAGVGAMAGAITGFLADYYGENCPIITIVEPNKADCIFKSASSKDGKIEFVKGDMDTIMAGLACGEPCTIGWEILREYADNFVSVPDYVAAKGMRILANPVGDDKKIVSGESGASTIGFFAEMMMNDSLSEYRKIIGIDSDSKILLISTEGDTDKEGYRNIVWEGKYPSI